MTTKRRSPSSQHGTRQMSKEYRRRMGLTLWQHQKFLCAHCGERVDEADISLDHIKPVSQWEDPNDIRINLPENLQVMHILCNKRLRDKGNEPV